MHKSSGRHCRTYSKCLKAQSTTDELIFKEWQKFEMFISQILRIIFLSILGCTMKLWCWVNTLDVGFSPVLWSCFEKTWWMKLEYSIVWILRGSAEIIASNLAHVIKLCIDQREVPTDFETFFTAGIRKIEKYQACWKDEFNNLEEFFQSKPIFCSQLTTSGRRQAQTNFVGWSCFSSKKFLY